MAEIASCSICLLSLMEAGEETMALLCGHVYHTTCVDTYMKAAHLDQLTLRCPVCKMTSKEAEAKQEVLSEDANAPAMQRPPLQVPLSWTVSSSPKDNADEVAAVETVVETVPDETSGNDSAASGSSGAATKFPLHSVTTHVFMQLLSGVPLHL